MNRAGVIAALVGAALSSAGAASGGISQPAAGARSIAVSVPADPVPVRPGHAAHIVIRVVNPGPRAVAVRVASRSLRFGDDGKVALGSGSDPRWGGRVRFPARPLQIPADGWRAVSIAVRVPRRLPPDLYFIGFLVTPVEATGGSIKVVNQIGSFLTIDLPGPRLRRLVGHLDLPGFALGSHAGGTLRLTNAGAASLSFWGETDTTSSPGGAFVQRRLPPSLLPAGRSRTIGITGKPRWPIGIVTVTTRITYPGRTDSSTRQLVFSRRVVVVSPWALVVLGGTLAGLGGAALWLHRRRRRRRATLVPVLHGG